MKRILLLLIFLLVPSRVCFAEQSSVKDLLRYAPEEKEVVVDYSDKSISVNGADSSLRKELDITNSAPTSTIERSLEDSGYIETKQNGRVITYHSRFENKRLFVKGNPDAEEVAFAKIAGWTILQFDSIEDTQSAYDNLKLRGYTVFPDEMRECNANLLSGEEYMMNVGAGELNLLPLQQASSKDVTVAVLDTGYNGSSYFGERVLTPVNYTTEVDASDTWNNGAGHGTEVVSVILDATGDNVKVLPLKVLPADGVGTQVYLVSAFEDIFKNGNADVINICIGWQCDSEDEAALCSFWNDIIAEAMDTYQIPVIVASGNTATKDTCYPANIDDVWTVGSTGVSVDGLIDSDKVSDFSNYGKVDFVARGYYVGTINASGNLSYTSGTSVSAPLITAFAAGLLSARDFISCEELYETIQESCVDLGDVGYDMYYGWGRPLYNETLLNPCRNGHDFSLSSTVDATCIAPKTMIYTCTRCSETKVETEGDVNPDKHSGGYRYPVTTASCETPSYKIKTCKGCSAEISRSVFSAALGHSLSETPDATYEELSEDKTENVTYEVYSCTRCTHTEVKEISRVSIGSSANTEESSTTQSSSESSSEHKTEATTSSGTTEPPKTETTTEASTEQKTEQTTEQNVSKVTYPKKTKIVSVKNKSKRKLVVKCVKQSGCRYHFQYATNKKFKKAVSKKTSSRQITFKKLKMGKKYYVRVRTMKKINGKWKYSPWSKVKSIRVKK